MNGPAPTARKTLVVLVVALSLTTLFLTIATGPASAAADKFKAEYFNVVVSGVQKTTQTFHYKPENECDVSDNSTITEKVAFQSRPKTMIAYHLKGEVNPLLLFDQPGKWMTAATVTRHYTPRIVVPPPSPRCGENDGGGESTEAKPDCGTKKVADYGLELEFDQHEKSGLRLLGGDHKDPFENCLAPLGDLGFPFLILEDTSGKKLLGDLPEDELFDPGLGKIIVLAGGTQKVEEEGVSAKASIEWNVSFTRTAKPKGS